MYTKALLTVMVSDMKRALEFYADTLGMARGPQYGDEWAEVDARGLRIGLHPGGKRPLSEHSRHFSIGLRVDDLDTAVAALAAKGVAFQPTRQDRGSRLANFTDPDGNPLYLIELKWG
jgi:catechol 2,3-dioxygenase-like lactoylglutathione lyase family enzyme